MTSRTRKRLGEPFGKAGLVVAILALVLAMAGGAYAAGALSGKQKKEVETIAKRYAGKPGAAGATGAPGPAGPAGAKGDTGAAGANGASGSNGANGVSVTSEEFGGVGGPCAEGGTEFNSASPDPTYACNGHEGSPWSAGGTLPTGKTETGVWAAGPFGGTGVETMKVPISFPIPLAEGAAVTAHFINKPSEGGTTECPAEESYELMSELPAPGNLCVYKQTIEGGSVRTESGGEPPFFSPTGGIGVDPFGTLMLFYSNTEAGGELHPNAIGHGVWAVTAP